MKNTTVGLVASLMAISVSHTALANNTNATSTQYQHETYEFVKSRLQKGNSCDAKCMTLSSPTVYIEDEMMKISYVQNSQKEGYGSIPVPSGVKVEKVSLSGEPIDFIWDSQNNILFKTQEGRHFLTIEFGYKNNSVSMGFEYEPAIQNNSKYPVTENNKSLTIKVGQDKEDNLEPKVYDGFYMVNRNGVLKNGELDMEYSIRRSQLGGNGANTITLPKMNNNLQSSRNSQVTDLGNEWRVEIPAGVPQVSFGAKMDIEHFNDTEISLQDSDIYFDNILIQSAPNYRLYENASPVDEVMINHNDEPSSLMYEDVNIAEANDVILKNVNHVIDETSYGYHHTLSFNLESSNSETITIPVESKGSLSNLQTNDAFFENKNIIVNNSRNGHYTLRFQENIEKQTFLIEPASIEIDNVAGYKVELHKEGYNDITTWIFGDFDGKTQSATLFILLLSILVPLALMRTLKNKDTHNNILIAFAPVLLAMSILYVSFLLSLISLLVLAYISHRMSKIDSPEVLKGTKIVAFAVFVGFLFLISIQEIQGQFLYMSHSVTSYSAIKDSTISAYSFYSTPSLKVVNIPDVATMLFVVLPSILMLLKIFTKKEAKKLDN